MSAIETIEKRRCPLCQANGFFCIQTPDGLFKYQNAILYRPTQYLGTTAIEKCSQYHPNRKVPTHRAR